MATTTEANVHSRARASVGHDRATASAAILLRLAAAYLWNANLSGKNPPDFGKSDGNGLYGYMHAAMTNPVLGVWSSVIENVVMPNFVIFGWFTVITETCLAIFLFLGLATRFWALVGVLQSFAIYFTVGGLSTEWKWSYLLKAATHLALLGFAAGRVLGQVLRLRVTGSSLLARAYRLAS